MLNGKLKMRKLSEAELIFIRDNTNLSLDDLKNKIPDGDPKEIEVLVGHYKDRSTREAKTDVNSEDSFIAGNLMAKREGVTIMTPAASELADARKTLRVTKNPKFAEDNKNKIHVIRK